MKRREDQLLQRASAEFETMSAAREITVDAVGV